ncbi:hypothetical protein G7Z17_g260 [Cylindrodendrum hubeiense]|uniref:FAD/NAD(P)-binding domain-containing protein n=1 Tax=Cylindrodendrum hubeiense TaxID=595255 RepID=A0A9P5HSK2_9HYPO|nr:hypothetical protein G7Z17_g260 [Cylindrodendrum hubeiense]
MSKTIVILGAGLAGLPAAHYILKHLATKLDLKVLLVSPAEDYYWTLGTLRVVVPDQMGEDKIFYSIPKIFHKYPPANFEFVHGRAETWDPETNSVLVAMNDGTSRTINYHTIIVATGSSAKGGMPWKLVGDSSQTHAAIAKLRDQVKNAHSIVVGGAGATGVEFAGELGSAYAKTGEKTVTIITNESSVLENRMNGGLRKRTQKNLEKLKIKVITNTKVTNVTEDETGSTTVELTRSDGTVETVQTDLFVPTWGLSFNSDFAPADMRLPNGRLKVTETMQAHGYDNAFIVGDVADCEPGQIAYAEAQVKHVMKALEQYLSGGKMPKYIRNPMVGQLLSIGQDYGAGQMGNWQIWGWFAWYFKSRYLGTDYAPACANGERFVIFGSI